MKKNLQKILIIALFLVFIPSFASASWWNPFTWKIFNRPQKAPAAVVATTTTPISDQSAEIEKLKKEVEPIANEITTEKPPVPPATKLRPQPLPISSPKIDFINPAIVVASRQNTLQINGSGFHSGGKVIIGNDYLEVISTQPTLISVSLPVWLQPGTYDVKITNPDGGYFALGKALTVRQPVDQSPTQQNRSITPQLQSSKIYADSIYQKLGEFIAESNRQRQNMIAELERQRQEMNTRLKPLEEESARLQVERDQKCPAGILLTGEAWKACHTLLIEMEYNTAKQRNIIAEYGGSSDSILQPRFTTPLPSYEQWYINSLPGGMSGSIWSPNSSQRFQYDCLAPGNCTIFGY